VVPHRCDLIYSPKFSDELIQRCWLKVYKDSYTLRQFLSWVILFEDGSEREANADSSNGMPDSDRIAHLPRKRGLR
jgi:hypothetical protein